MKSQSGGERTLIKRTARTARKPRFKITENSLSGMVWRFKCKSFGVSIATRAGGSSKKRKVFVAAIGKMGRGSVFHTLCPPPPGTKDKRFRARSPGALPLHGPVGSRWLPSGSGLSSELKRHPRT